MLSFLKIRAIVNGIEIYPLPDSKPVVIPLFQNNPRLVITDGYHITRPVKLVFKELPVYCFRVQCAITDRQLIGGFVVLSVLYLLGYVTSQLVFKVFSFIPLVYLAMFYYLNRKDFIKLIPVIS